MNIQPTSMTMPPSVHPLTTGVVSRDLAVARERGAQDTAESSSSTKVLQVEREKVEAATKSVREFVEPINSNIEFTINDDTGQLVVKIVDRTTKEVIRQIPSQELLSIAKALDSIKGLFVKQSA